MTGFPCGKGIPKQPCSHEVTKSESKGTLRDLLHHLQARHTPQDLLVNGQSPIPLLTQELRRRRQDAPKRQFLKFRFSTNAARDLMLREVLRTPEVYHKHPEPDAAAAIMVSDSFAPQIQAFLFNYTDAARELDVGKAAADNLMNCRCHHAFTVMLGPNGHVCTLDTQNLRWGYLSSMTQRGKKYRLPASEDTVKAELDKALTNYTDWALKQDPTASRAEKLQDWANAVRTKAICNWRVAQGKRPVGTMDGYPGLKQAIKEAQEHLVFLHDDRAPHGLFMVCKRWYQQQMASHLQDTEIFQEEPRPWKDIAAEVSQELKRLGFQAGTGIPYNYGIWKPKKGKFRFIAGTRSTPPDVEQVEPTQDGRRDSPLKKEPPRSPTYHLSKSPVKVLDHVGKPFTILMNDAKGRPESGATGRS